MVLLAVALHVLHQDLAHLPTSPLEAVVVRNLEPAVAKPHVLLHHQYLQWTTMMLSLV